MIDLNQFKNKWLSIDVEYNVSDLSMYCIGIYDGKTYEGKNLMTDVKRFKRPFRIRRKGKTRGRPSKKELILEMIAEYYQKDISNLYIQYILTGKLPNEFK